MAVGSRVLILESAARLRCHPSTSEESKPMQPAAQIYPTRRSFPANPEPHPEGIVLKMLAFHLLRSGLSPVERLPCASPTAHDAAHRHRGRAWGRATHSSFVKASQRYFRERLRVSARIKCRMIQTEIPSSSAQDAG